MTNETFPQMIPFSLFMLGLHNLQQNGRDVSESSPQNWEIKGMIHLNII